MTIARERLVDPSVTRYYHCISRCVRRAFLCGEGYEHRKQWIEDRLEVLAECFAVSVCGFAILDNHLHVLVRLDGDVANDWSAEEVVRRWIRVYPPRELRDAETKLVDQWVKQQLQDAKKVGTMRERLTKLGWFMKALKEPLARLANKEDGCKGTFWEGRYKSIAILDTEALLATCVYIDLNVVAAGKAATPETSRHTSIRQRVRHAAATPQRRRDAGDVSPARIRSRGRPRPATSSRIIGCVRWKIGGSCRGTKGRDQLEKACCPACRWAGICCWWITRVDSIARERPVSVAIWQACSSDWARVRRCGVIGCSSCLVRGNCWAAISRPTALASVRWPMRGRRIIWII